VPIDIAVGYFTLQDPDANATISCVVWNSLLDKLAQPNPGEQLIVLGSIRLYPQRGQYQLTVWQTLPAGKVAGFALPAVAKPVGVGGIV